MVIRESLDAVAAVAPGRQSLALAPTHLGHLGVSTCPSEDSCWSISFGSKTSTWATMTKLYMPGLVDSSGTKAVIVNPFGATPSQNVACIAYAVGKAASSM